MSSEDNKRDVNSSASFGGSTYRLSYDHAENKKNKEKRSAGSKTFVAIVLAVLLLFVFAFLALKYYDDAIKKLYSSETTADENGAEADFQSSVNILTD